MKKILIFFIIFLSLSSSVFVAVRVWDQDDLGDIIFEQFTYSIAVDCEKAQLYLIVMNGTNLPVENATTYLQYLENSNQIISRITTPKNGTALHQLPGNTSYMRSRWNLLIEKNGYRNKAVQFDLAPCYSNWTPAENTYVKQTTTPISYNQTQNQTTQNYSNNYTYNNTYQNQSYIETSSSTVVEWVPVIALIAILLIIFKYVKQTKVCKKNFTGFSSTKLYWRKGKKPVADKNASEEGVK
ncbi:MAG: hypothetical protein ABH842_00450 [Candidatus Micrarchaeota archaeon]